jgi:hypothetical protein
MVKLLPEVKVALDISTMVLKYDIRFMVTNTPAGSVCRDIARKYYQPLYTLYSTPNTLLWLR